MEPVLPTYPALEYFHIVVYCRTEHRQLIEALGVCHETIQHLSPKPLCNTYQVLGDSANQLGRPWRSKESTIGDKFDVQFSAERKRHFKLDPVLDTLSSAEFSLDHVSIDHMIRDENWGWFANEWDIEINRAALVGEQRQEVALRLSINARSALIHAREQEREADLACDLMAALANLSDVVDAYYGFVDCTFFADDCSGSYYGYTPFAAQMTSVPVRLDFDRWREAGLKRKGLVPAIHWAQLIAEPLLTTLGGRNAFREEFYGQIRNWRFPDGMLFLRECEQGLIIKLSQELASRLIGNRGLGSVWDLPASWLESRLREEGAMA